MNGCEGEEIGRSFLESSMPLHDRVLLAQFVGQVEEETGLEVRALTPLNCLRCLGVHTQGKVAAGNVEPRDPNFLLIRQPLHPDQVLLKGLLVVSQVEGAVGNEALGIRPASMLLAWNAPLKL